MQASCAGLPDIERLTRKLERRKTTLADLCQLYRASSRLPLMLAALQEYDGPHAQLLSSRCARLPCCLCFVKHHILLPSAHPTASPVNAACCFIPATPALAKYFR